MRRSPRRSATKLGALVISTLGYGTTLGASAGTSLVVAGAVTAMSEKARRFVRDHTLEACSN